MWLPCCGHPEILVLTESDRCGKDITFSICGGWQMSLSVWDGERQSHAFVSLCVKSILHYFNVADVWNASKLHQKLKWANLLKAKSYPFLLFPKCLCMRVCLCVCICFLLRAHRQQKVGTKTDKPLCTTWECMFMCHFVYTCVRVSKTRVC